MSLSINPFQSVGSMNINFIGDAKLLMEQHGTVVLIPSNTIVHDAVKE